MNCETMNHGQSTPFASRGLTRPISAKLAGSGTAPVAATAVLSDLAPGTTYHYRLLGANETGTTDGGDRTFVTTVSVDSDGDGIPDDYELAHGLDPHNPADGSADSDGDGMTNYQEYLAGTDPRSASSAHAAQRKPACLPEQLLWIAPGVPPPRANACAAF